MTARVASLWRYPIKGIGSEALSQVTLEAEAPMPGDRAWALRHAAAEAGEGWLPRRNFCVVANGPKLAQITAETRGANIHLTHPDQVPLTLVPRTDGPALIAWLKDLWPADRPAPERLVKAPAHSMADNGAAEVSLLNLASLDALTGAAEGAEGDVSIKRFRGNLVLSGLEPWQEFDWIGRDIAVGAVRLRVTGRIDRCRATEANPDTGLRDIDVPRVLRETWGHKDFGVYARVLTGGDLSLGDTVTP